MRLIQKGTQHAIIVVEYLKRNPVDEIVEREREKSSAREVEYLRQVEQQQVLVCASLVHNTKHIHTHATDRRTDEQTQHLCVCSYTDTGRIRGKSERLPATRRATIT